MSAPRFLLRPLAEILADPGPWQDLADGAIEPTPFLTPAFVAAAVGRIAPKGWLAATLTASDGRLDLLALVRRRWHPTIGPWLDGFHSAYGPLAPPLMRHVDRSGLALWLDGLAGLTPVLRLSDLALDGPVAKSLATAFEARRVMPHAVAVHTRACLINGRAADEALGTDLKGRRRADLARRLRNLAATGAVDWRVETQPIAVDQALGAFMRLEADGWRRRSGLAGARNRQAFAQDFIGAMAAQGAARADILTHRGTPVAVLLTLSAGRQTVIWKVAHAADAAFASPGAQVIARATEHFLQSTGIDEVDSLAAPGHSLIERQWAGRKTMGSWIVALDPAAEPRAVRLHWAIETATRLKTCLRDTLRQIGNTRPRAADGG